MHPPEVLQHPTIVICDLFPEPTTATALPFSATTLGDLGHNGIPLSSMLNINPGLELRSFSSRVRSNRSKYLETISGFVALALTKESGAAVRRVKLG